MGLLERETQGWLDSGTSAKGNRFYQVERRSGIGERADGRFFEIVVIGPMVCGESVHLGERAAELCVARRRFLHPSHP